MAAETGSRQGATGDYRPLWPPERAMKSEEGNSPSHGAAMTAPSGRGPASPLWGRWPGGAGPEGVSLGVDKSWKNRGFAKAKWEFRKLPSDSCRVSQAGARITRALPRKSSLLLSQKRPIRVSGPARFAQHDRCHVKVLCFSLSKKADTSWRACPLYAVRSLPRKSSLLLSFKKEERRRPHRCGRLWREEVRSKIRMKNEEV